MLKKTCTRCLTTQPIESFAKRSDRPVGRVSNCKKCVSDKVKAWKKTPKGRETARRLNASYYARKGHKTKKAYDQSEHGRSIGRRLQANYRMKHPEKIVAHNAISSAIASGRIKRKPCKECGSSRSHAHHPDYSKPLKVMWLCQKHHIEQHKKEERKA